MNIAWSRFDPFRPRAPETDSMNVFVAALLLTGLGLICVYSFGPGEIGRQGVWAALGIAACLAVSRLPLERIRRADAALLIFVGGMLLFALLFAPLRHGTRRWLVVPSVGQFQPSELAKIAVVVFLASRLAVKGALDRGVWRVAWPVGVVAMLVLLAPDFGTAVFVMAVSMALLLVAGARVGRALAAAAVALPVLLLVAARYPYIQERLKFFQGRHSYHQVQALLALGSGGVFGNGIGAGRQKMSYLPEGHTDFVFSNVGEELGFIGVACVGLLFALILIYGMRVALAAERRRDRFSFFLVCGATLLVVFQAVVNIAVATAAAPTKGISLPFLSQGGSNLLVSFVAIGLILNVGRSLEART